MNDDIPVVITIPLYSDDFETWKMNVDLSGKRYGFYIAYNERQDAWSLSISDMNDNLLIGGLRLLPGVSLLDKYRASVPDLPPGVLVLVDNEARPDTAVVTRDNLSTRFSLAYELI